MKLSAYLTGLTTTAILLSSCGSKPDFADCVFPDAADTAAPGWICNQPMEGFELTAVGSTAKSAAGHDYMKSMAATSARVQLAQIMQVEVRKLLKQYIETTGETDQQTVDKVMTSVTRLINNQTLVGTRIVKTRKSPRGALYVLVGMDKASMQNASQKALQTSMQNDSALWQQFRSDKNQQELTEEIIKQGRY
jgi:hypothetical protein